MKEQKTKEQEGWWENIVKRQRGWTDRLFGDDGDDEVGRGRLIQRPA